MRSSPCGRWPSPPASCALPLARPASWPASVRGPLRGLRLLRSPRGVRSPRSRGGRLPGPPSSRSACGALLAASIPSPLGVPRVLRVPRPPRLPRPLRCPSRSPASAERSPVRSFWRGPRCAPSLRSDSLRLATGVAAAGAGVGVSLPNRRLTQANIPPEAAAGAGAAGWGARAAGAGLAAAGCGTASARGAACGAGASGNTPLITGVCLLVGSCERRVKAVGSSISSAIL